MRAARRVDRPGPGFEAWAFLGVLLLGASVMVAGSVIASVGRAQAREAQASAPAPAAVPPVEAWPFDPRTGFRPLESD